MEHFLIYIIVSSLVTLVSVVFAYKPEEDELQLVDFNQNPKESGKRESTSVYPNKPLKTTNLSVMPNKLEATLT